MIKKGIQTRYLVYRLLKKLKNSNLIMSRDLLLKTDSSIVKLNDLKMIENIVLNAMRHEIIIKEIIKKNTNKFNFSSDSYYLLLGAITQIIFLNFKNFAVIDTTVELSKKNKIKSQPKFINGILRNIDKRKSEYSKLKSNFAKLPNWFKIKTNNWTKKRKNDFIKTIMLEPKLHIVFKTKLKFNKMQINGIKTSNYSIAIKTNHNVKNIYGFKQGDWWVQDYASMMPLMLIDNIKNKSIADLCAAPGGKSFQLISKGAIIDSYEINEKRYKLMKENLNRLNYVNKCNLILKDVLNTQIEKKYDIVILDSPCSAVGTIRRHPEIFYRKLGPDFKKIENLQYRMLEKAKNLIKPNGEIIYMVCTFLQNECEEQIKKFLDKNKEFEIVKFSNKKFNDNLKLNNNGFYTTLPMQLENKVLIDGFFAARLINNG